MQHLQQQTWLYNSNNTTQQQQQQMNDSTCRRGLNGEANGQGAAAETAAAAVGDRPPSRSSQVQRRLAEAMALEAKAASAAVLRSPAASSTASLAGVDSMVPARSLELQGSGQHSRTPDRPRSPARSPRQGEHILIHP